MVLFTVPLPTLEAILLVNGLQLLQRALTSANTGGVCYPERKPTKPDDIALKTFAIRCIIIGKLQIVRFIRQDTTLI